MTTTKPPLRPARFRVARFPGGFALRLFGWELRLDRRFRTDRELRYYSNADVPSDWPISPWGSQVYRHLDTPWGMVALDHYWSRR